MSQTVQAHFVSLLNAGAPFRTALMLTSNCFRVPASEIERAFYRG